MSMSLSTIHKCIFNFLDSMADDTWFSDNHSWKNLLDTAGQTLLAFSLPGPSRHVLAMSNRMFVLCVFGSHFPVLQV